MHERIPQLVQSRFLFASWTKLYVFPENICFPTEEPYFPNYRLQNQCFGNCQMEQRLQIHQNESVCRRQFSFDKAVTERRQVSNSNPQCQLTQLPFMKAVGGLPDYQLFSSSHGMLLSCESWLPGFSVQPRLQGSWLPLSLPGGELRTSPKLAFPTPSTQLLNPLAAMMGYDLGLPFQVQTQILYNFQDPQHPSQRSFLFWVCMARF